MKFVIFAILISILQLNVSANNGLINKKVDRLIDLSTQLVKIKNKIVVENPTNNPVNEYNVIVERDVVDNLAFISAFLNVDGKDVELQVKKINRDNYAVSFGKDYVLGPQKRSNLLTINLVYTNILKPFPEFIKQNEPQLIKYNGNHHYFSLYKTITQQTKVKLPNSGSIESYSKLSPTAQIDRTINYGSYENVEPLSLSNMEIHYENNYPFLVVSKLKRKIEVSPWTDVVRIEDTIDIFHNGAKLEGPFSRYDFQKDPNSGLAVANHLKTKINKRAINIYYRDQIGNISSSDILPFRENLIITLKPRFPLFGGWKTHYKLGYQIPLDEVIVKKDQRNYFKVNYIDHIYDNLVIEESEVQIILPEGSLLVKVNPPFEVEKLPDQTKLTYLDLVGRKLITLRKNNLIDEHIKKIEIVYDYNPIWKLQEPLLILGTIILLIIGAFIYSKLDFSLVKKKQKVD